jgi:hypothetical protein
MIRRFCMRYRLAFQWLFVISSCVFAGLMLSGCMVPVWLTDATAIIPVLTSASASLLGAIGTLAGDPKLGGVATQLTAWGQKIEAGLNQVETLIQEYKQNPSDALIVQIQNAIQEVLKDLNTLGPQLNIPAPLQAKIQAYIQLVQAQLESLAALMGVLKPSVAAGTRIMDLVGQNAKVPMNKKEAKAAFNKILSDPTGDAGVDAAMAKAKKL